MRSLIVTLLLLVGVALVGQHNQALVALASAHVSAQSNPVSAVSGPDVFTGARLYVDRDSSAARAARAAEREGNHERADRLASVASQSHADWLGGWIPADKLAARVGHRSRAIRTAGALPVYVAYNLPQRDCGGLSAGGARDAASYRAWIDALAEGIGAGPAAVVLEPDALAQVGCLSRSAQQTRYDLIRYAVQRLTGNPATAVYLDAGNASWVPARQMARRLQLAGVAGARGFALNVANFGRTADQVTYGLSLSAATGGKHFVIDTSRNGRGRAGDGEWCNPPGRALGQKPLSGRPSPAVDALLWVKTPGASDGQCNAGPKAGTFWPAYAAGLASRAAS